MIHVYYREKVGGVTHVGEGTPDFLCGGSQGSHEPDLEPSPSVTRASVRQLMLHL